jgi:hypothetical protein
MNNLEIKIPTIATKCKEDLSIVERLGLSRAPDWRLMVRDLERIEKENPETMQLVLDYVSPTKSPIRDLSPDLVDTDEGVVNDEYIFTTTNKVLGEGISKVKLARHIKTGGMVLIRLIFLLLILS